MIFRKQCNSCKKKKLFVYKRTYELPAPVGIITSKAPLCRLCYKKVKFMLKA